MMLLSIKGMSANLMHFDIPLSRIMACLVRQAIKTWRNTWNILFDDKCKFKGGLSFRGKIENTYCFNVEMSRYLSPNYAKQES